jgi:hypothetical protein
MNPAKTHDAGATEKRRKGPGALVWRLVSGLAFFAIGVALSAWWFLRAPAAPPENPAPGGLSEATQAVLQRLNSPVEIRFYSLLDPASVSDSGREFSARVDQLLAQYEQEAGGKIKVARINSFSSSTANAASADGIQPFNLDKGDACYLGIAVVRGKERESLSSLQPEWEQALEPDLTRAIARAIRDDSPVASAPRADTVTLEKVRKLIPNLDSVSVEEGTKILRQSALAQFRQSVDETQARIKEAEDRFLQAQAANSEDGQDAARKEIQQIQADQSASIRRLTAASQAQINALQQIKGAIH